MAGEIVEMWTLVTEKLRTRGNSTSVQKIWDKIAKNKLPPDSVFE